MWLLIDNLYFFVFYQVLHWETPVTQAVTKKNSITECALYVTFITDLTERKF